MENFLSSFLYAGGPLFILCFIIGWTPYYFNTPSWNDANLKDPIRLGLGSSIYSYALVAVISASLPPCLELMLYIFFCRGNSVKRTMLILANMFIFISPEIASLIFVSPSSDSKLYFLLLNNRMSMSLFFAMLLLCQFSEKSWRCVLSTVIVSFIYVSSLINTLAPYFDGIIGIWIQKLGISFQFFGCIFFIIKSFNFLLTNPATKESDFMIVDNILCKFVTLSILFIIISVSCVYVSAGLPCWTQWNSTFITTYTIIFSLPNVLIGVAFSYATRNETIFLQHTKQTFINYISHEMRTPLNTAVMGLQYLRNELMKADAHDEIMLTVDEVSNACEISVSILSEMLDFDKLKSGLMKMELEVVPVREFLEDTISPFYLQAGLKDIILGCNLDSVTLANARVSVDKSKFAQVIRNLLSNALKFTPTGGTVTITSTVRPLASPSLNHRAVGVVGSTSLNSSQRQLLIIEVTDTGAGISKENQKKLFKEMVQFNPGKLQSGGGTGLGLYSIMDLLHGTLSVKSEGEGHGSTFTISILAKYIDDTIDIELPEYKVEDEDVGGQVQRPLVTEGSIQSTNNNNILSNRTHHTNNEIFRTGTPSVDISSGRFPLMKRASSIRSIGSATSRVTPLLRSDSFRSTTASICGQILHNDSYDGNSTVSNRISYSLKILIVDDSKSNRKMLMRLLRDRCSLIGEAVDGVDAVNQINDMLLDEEPRQYDAILMDFIMPNMEGPEAAQCIRNLGYQGLIVGITGNVLAVDKERFLSQGADLVLTKPINILDIDDAFRRIPYPPTATTTTTITTTIANTTIPFSTANLTHGSSYDI